MEEVHNLETLELQLNTLKEQLIQSENLANIGQLTAGILHEIRNPLNFVANFSKISIDLIAEMRDYTDTLSKKSNSEEVDEIAELSIVLENNLGKIIENCSRAERVIQNMLAQTHQRSDSYILTDINLLVEEAVKLAYQGVRGNDKQFNVALTYKLDKSIDKINVVSHDLTRVLINLVNNSCYAINEKKKLNIENYKPEITATTKKLANAVEIKIRDNGTGMPREVREKLFKPFYTTKPVGQGTGLGLSMSFDIIRNLHKGKMEVCTEENQFTEFTMTIPINL